MAIHSTGQTVFIRSHIEGITLGAGEEVDEVGDRASEGQAAGVYGAGFTLRSLARKGTRVGTGKYEIRDLSELLLSAINASS